MATIGERLRNGWNAFIRNKDPAETYSPGGEISYTHPDRVRLTMGNERTIIASIYERIAIDVASISIKHVRVNENDQYIETINSALNDILSFEANIDQTSRDFIEDIVISLFDEGCIAIVPVDTDVDPIDHSSFEILSARVAKILCWYPDAVRVRIYNDRTGRKEELTLPKKSVAIINNPFYSVMNEQNSTLKRLNRKLALLDITDNRNSSGKLDLIIQLPYVIKSQTRKEQAEMRRKEIETQLASSKYGIAYTDGTEHITQLNRAVENNLLSQVQYLTQLLYSQLGITEQIMNGTASEEEMLNYYNRTVEPVLSAIVDEFKRKFLTKTARTQRQSIAFFRDPFKLVPINSIADIADKFTRNEIFTSNEVRGIMGFKPSSDPRADQLLNKNINHAAKNVQTKSDNTNNQSDDELNES